MADVLKVVAARIQATSLSATEQPTLNPQPPVFGIIIAEASSELSPQETRTVLWQSGLVQDVVAGAVADLNLDVIEDAEVSTVDEFEGQVVLRIAPGGPVPGDPDGGTSHEFQGPVVAVYKRTPIQAAAGTGSDFVLVYVYERGTYFEGLASTFTVLTNR